MNSMASPVVQWQVITKDPTKHASFYADVFGWKIRTDNSLGYRMVESGNGRGIDGGFWPAPPEANAFVQLFVEVDDIGETVKRVKEAGGDVLIPAQMLPDGDQMAILRDPMGMSFGVVVPSKR
jgi:predicted enzyme related to lactoylglutathione lyase